MRRSYIWGIIAGIYGVGYLLFFGVTWEESQNWDESTKFFAFLGWWFVFIPLGVAGYYSHFKEKDKFAWTLNPTPTYHDIESTRKYKTTIIVVSLIGLVLMIVGYQDEEAPHSPFLIIPGIILAFVGFWLILRMIGKKQDEKKNSKNS